MKRSLVLIVALGFAIRLVFLGARQPWTDELMQALIAREGLLSGLFQHLRNGMWMPAPLDYLAQKLFVLILGEAPWALRLHSAVFAGLSLWVFFRVATRLFGDRVALYSTVLFALFPLHYHFSQEGRPWSLLVLLSLLCFDHLLQMAAGERRSWREWSGLTFGLALALYTSIHGIALILAQWVALAVVAGRKSVCLPLAERPGTIGTSPAECYKARRVDVWTYAVCALAALVLFAPWLRYAWRRPMIAAVWEVLGYRLVPRLLKETGDGSYFISALVFLGFATGFVALRRHGRLLDRRFLLAWAGVPLPTVLALDVATGYFFGIEQILVAAPAIVLTAGYGLWHLGEQFMILARHPYRLSTPAILYAIALLLSTGWTAWSHQYDAPVNWAGTARFLQESVRPGDALATPNVGALLEYYAPVLAQYRLEDLDPGPGVLSRPEVQRRIVVCYKFQKPDSCRGFREAAAKDKSWSRRDFAGFTIFIREKQPTAAAL